MGSQFTIKGEGKIKSVSGYSFLFSSLVSTLAGQDKVRVKIWKTNNPSEVIYDNQPGAPDDAEPTLPMPKGDIKIKY